MRAILVIVLVVAAEASAARPFRKGAVATEHPIATEAALSMLDKGGNAVDAAVAAAFALGVVSPFHSGIGGGGFALVWDAKAASASVLDFREVAPKAAFRDMYLKDGKVVPKLSTDGALSVAVPGAAMGYLELLQKHGKLKPPVVLAPAIAAAKKGFWVTPKYARVSRERLEATWRQVIAALAPPERLVLIAPFTQLLPGDWRVPFLPLARRVVKELRPFANADFGNPSTRKVFEAMNPALDLDDPTVQVALRDVRLPLSALDELRKTGQGALRVARRVRCPVLVIQGFDDRTVPPWTTRRLVERFAGRVTLIEVPGDHQLVRLDHPSAELAFRLIGQYVTGGLA